MQPPHPPPPVPPVPARRPLLKTAPRLGAVARAVTAANSTSRSVGERVMYARKQRLVLQKNPVTGGTPITPEEAVTLRQVTFGSALVPPRTDWLRSGLVFREPEQPLGFGLVAARSTTGGLLSVVQAQVIKHLLFDSAPRDAQRKVDELLRPTLMQQQEALIHAISTILWRAGEKTCSRVCLPQDLPIVAASQNFLPDGVTEKLHLYEFTTLEDLQIFIKRYSYMFQEETGPGMMLLLYSAVLSRGPSKVMKDLDNDKAFLMGAAEEGSHCVIMLLLTGRATPYLHNGVIYVGDEDHYALPQFGVLARTEVGLLWDEATGSDDESRKPGSRLKTPSLPVWVIRCAGHYGVIFSTNRELLRNYHAERRFELQYYTCEGGYCQMTVDTRYEEDQNSSKETNRENSVIPQLEKVIHTK
ncbi:inactive ubiquitin carboxyl-terminal hydrolase MINDY-4B isoform X1 [Schistocerca serialis cubense]|uniref:inactive ubiquitin carboxyl-terminal hydrolase MINDY-4B isoform X1 n=1 Tax=Schistocerca serialis cubense TaxID=2023355 RepID=UPI00214F2902|nr:inactive ubiquitin carboxyl-terminal hydrolase MINDY-4B isoform X1 [Schistocerca serialis cubense]